MTLIEFIYTGPPFAYNLLANLMFWILIIVGAVSLIVMVILIALLARKHKRVDVSALAALALTDQPSEDVATNADPKEVVTILQIERVAANNALSAVKDAKKTKRISASVSDSLINRYSSRIAKIDSDIKRRYGAEEYKSLAESLEQSRDRLRDEIGMPETARGSTLPPPPTTPSRTPGIPPTAPPVPGVNPPFISSRVPPSATTGLPSSIPPVPSFGSIHSQAGKPPGKPTSPIPTPPKIPAIGPSPTARPTTVVPPSIAPPSLSTPPLPPKTPTQTIAPPITSDILPPPVPISIPTTSTTTLQSSGDSDSQSISGLRMEMLKELARLKKFMSEETQQ